jgi:integrase
MTPFVLLAVNTGLRRGEILQLCWRDVDLQRRILTVRGEGAKTEQTRHVPLNRETVKLLNPWKPVVLEPYWCVFGGADSSTPLVAIKEGLQL